MPDFMDRLVEAELITESEQPKPVGIDDEDKELVEAGAMSRQAARELTDSIKASATATYILVSRAHELKAWKSLGYSTWEEYVKSEFDMSASRSYQLINQANVIQEIASAAPEGTKVLLSEVQARDIKNELPKITEKVKASTAGDSPDDASRKINDIVDDARKQKKSDKKKEADDGPDLDDWGDEDPNAGDKRHPDDPPVEGAGFSSSTGGTPAPKNDRLSEKDSGSTADEPVDLDNLGSGVVTSDENMMNLEYAFQFIEALSTPEDVLEAFTTDAEREELKTKVASVIDWFTKFNELLNK